MIDLSLNFEEPEGAVAMLKFSIKICSETGKQIFPLNETAEDSYTRARHITMRHWLVNRYRRGLDYSTGEFGPKCAQRHHAIYFTKFPTRPSDEYDSAPSRKYTAHFVPFSPVSACC